MALLRGNLLLEQNFKKNVAYLAAKRISAPMEPSSLCLNVYLECESQNRNKIWSSRYSQINLPGI